MQQRLGKPQLLDCIARSVSACGWQVVYLSSQHPFILNVYNEMESYRLRVYVWNMTHGGGRARPADEYRIQVTGVERFEPEPAGKTLILGWWQEAGIFAGFDYRRHSGQLGASPSIQIRERYLRQAYEHGFSACNKGSGEVAVAFRPDFLVEYVKNLEELHDFGESERELDILEAATADPTIVNDVELNKVAKARRRALVSAVRTLRDNGFKDRVLTAYNNRCAVCGVQLKLVEAAHIIPVAVDGSTDETNNGVALCVLHHRAFDRALIAIDDVYKVVVSIGETEILKIIGHDGGLKEFRKALRPIIILPPAVSDRPHIDNLRRGREIRRWNS